MDKHEFLTQLRIGLSGLPQDDIEERVTFYREMIEDRVEEGLSEEEATSAVGSVDNIVSQIVADIPLARIEKERITLKRRLKVWEIVLLALGSPIWLSLGIAFIAVTVSLYVSLWAVIISLWAVFVSMICCSLAGVLTGLILAHSSNVLTGTVVASAGIVCAGLSIFTFYGCKSATNGTLMLTKKLALWIKNCFIRKEKV